MSERYKAMKREPIKTSAEHHNVYSMRERLLTLPMKYSQHLVIDIDIRRMQNSIVTLNVNDDFSIVSSDSIANGS